MKTPMHDASTLERVKRSRRDAQWLVHNGASEKTAKANAELDRETDSYTSFLDHSHRIQSQMRDQITSARLPGSALVLLNAQHREKIDAHKDAIHLATDWRDLAELTELEMKYLLVQCEKRVESAKALTDSVHKKIRERMERVEEMAVEDRRGSPQMS